MTPTTATKRKVALDGAAGSAASGASTANGKSQLVHLRWQQIADLAWGEVHGTASEDTLAALASDPIRWEGVLLDLLEQIDDSLQTIRHLPRQTRRQVTADFRSDLNDLTKAYVRLTGRDPSPPQPLSSSGASGNGKSLGGDRDGRHGKQGDKRRRGEPQGAIEPAALQLSWDSGRVVAWLAGANSEPESTDMVLDHLATTGAIEGAWAAHKPVKLPAGNGAMAVSAEAVVADLSDILGWLVALSGPTASATGRAGAGSGNGANGASANGSLSNGTTTDSADISATDVAIDAADTTDAADDINGSDTNGTDVNTIDLEDQDPNEITVETDTQQLLGDSAVWMRTVCLVAVDLVARGRTVPLLRRIRSPRNRSKPDTGTFSVKWQPAVLATGVLSQLADSLPASVKALTPNADPKALIEEVLGTTVSALMHNVTARIEVPQAPHDPRTRAELIEAYLASMAGERFTASASVGSELTRRLDQWARPVTTPVRYPLLVQLDEPDEAGAWHMSVLAPGPNNALDPVEVAMVAGTTGHRAEVKAQLARLERLLPVLMRPGGKRRGEVILDQAEAWDLMAVTGPALEDAGFAVRVPQLSRQKPEASLRLTAEDDPDSVLGAQQLTAVSWTAMFGDIELTAAQIRDLASQARPLIQNRGTWVALDHADLAEAAAALAERADVTELTGAQMLRQALGLEGAALAGGVSIAEGGWAADLLAAAAAVQTDPPTRPEGFTGELRHYQAEALGWLDFLDEAGLGGCLALDMGLGKTPTVLARIAQTVSQGNGSTSAASASDLPTLVIAPPAVVSNWASESARFTPELKVMIHHGSARADADQLPTQVAKAHLVITTYGTAVRDIDVLSELQWDRVVVDEAQVIKNHNSETARQLRRLQARTRIALTGTPIENGLADLWSIMDFCTPGLVGDRAQFIAHLSKPGDGDAATESALHALNGVLVFRRTKTEPSIAAELPDRIDDLDHCTMSPEQVGLYQAVLDQLIVDTAESEQNLNVRKGAVLAAITALKQICNHPLNYRPNDDDQALEGRSGKLARLNEILEVVFAAQEKVLIFTHFATWGERMAKYLTKHWDMPIDCYHGGLSRGPRDEMVRRFQSGSGAGAMVLSLKAGGTGLNLAAASHVVLYDRWWNPAVEDQARDRAWRIGQTKTVICHRLVCPGTVDERVEEVVAGKRRIADMILPKSSSLGDLDAEQLRAALGINENLLTELTETENGLVVGK